MAADSPERVRALVHPVVSALGLDLEQVAVTTAGRRRLLRVVVDGDHGVSLDAVADVTRAVSAALDDSDVMGGQPYVLEVSSPGVDRPLTEPKHWRRATSRLVKVSLVGGEELTGRVLSVSDDGVVLELAEAGERTLAFADVARAQVEVEFGRRADTSDLTDLPADLASDADADSDAEVDADSDEPDED